MLISMLNYLRVKLASKKGQGMVEYGLIIGIIAVVIVAALTFLKAPLNTLFEHISDIITNNTPTAPATSTTP